MTEKLIQLDPKSLAILAEIDEIHRHSLINIAISLVSKTEFFKTISNKIETSSELSEITSLKIIKSVEEKAKEEIKEVKTEIKKPKSSWNDF